MDNKIRLGVIGVGNMGTSHVRHVADGRCPAFEVTAVADLKPERSSPEKSRPSPTRSKCLIRDLSTPASSPFRIMITQNMRSNA